MAFDQRIVDADEGLIRTGRTFDLGFFTHSAPPFVGARRRVAAAPSLAVLPTDGENVSATAKQTAEQGDLYFDRRTPIDAVGNLSRKSAFRKRRLGRGLRTQRVDLGLDRRTLTIEHR
jgi:hypothetical protein